MALLLGKNVTGGDNIRLLDDGKGSSDIKEACSITTPVVCSITTPMACIETPVARLETPVARITTPVPKEKGVVQQLVEAWQPCGNLKAITNRPDGALDCLDGVRAFAVVWVVLYHCFVGFEAPGSAFGHDTHPKGPPQFVRLYDSWVSQPALSGDLGVDLFFVLSGFLIALQAVRELKRTKTINYPGFLWARWWRIAPAYYGALVVLVILDTQQSRKICAKSWWTNVLFINNLVGHNLGLDQIQACALHTWSIAMEFQFYIFTPFIVLLACNRDGSPRKAWSLYLMFIFVLFQVVRITVYYMLRESDDVGSPPPVQMINVLWTRGHTYLCGIAACIAYSSKSIGDEPSKRWRLVDILAGCAILGIIATGNGMDEKRWVARWHPYLNEFLILFSQGILAAAVAWLIFRCCAGHLPHFNTLLAVRMWVPLARLSYSAYLLQFIGILAMKKRSDWVFEPDYSVPLAFLMFLCFYALCLLMVFLTSLVHFMLIEGPSLQLRRLITPRCLKRG